MKLFRKSDPSSTCFGDYNKITPNGRAEYDCDRCPEVNRCSATNTKPHMKQPGELFDRYGVPVYPGDLIKSYHFTGPRNKRYYMYHTAIYERGAMMMVPTSHLEPTLKESGGKCIMDQFLMDGAEVIAGHGPGEILSYEDRAKRKVTPNG